jgi:hypothetical protein
VGYIFWIPGQARNDSGIINYQLIHGFFASLRMTAVSLSLSRFLIKKGGETPPQFYFSASPLVPLIEG